MLWRLGIAAPILVGILGCATARPAPAPAPAPAVSAPTAAASLESIAGDYTLIAIDGHALPYPTAAAHDEARSSSWPVLNGTLTLRADGTFHVETTYNTKPGGTEKNSYQFTGTCFGGGEGFRMIWDGGGETALAVRGDTVVLTNEGRSFSYVRR